jgi:hypothetical protein
MATKAKQSTAESVKSVPWDRIARWAKETAAERRKFLEIKATGAVQNHPKEVLDGFEEGYRQGYHQAVKDLRMHGFVKIQY